MQLAQQMGGLTLGGVDPMAGQRRVAFPTPVGLPPQFAHPSQQYLVHPGLQVCLSYDRV